MTSENKLAHLLICSICNRVLNAVLAVVRIGSGFSGSQFLAITGQLLNQGYNHC